MLTELNHVVYLLCVSEKSIQERLYMVYDENLSLMEIKMKNNPTKYSRESKSLIKDINNRIKIHLKDGLMEKKAILMLSNEEASDIIGDLYDYNSYVQSKNNQYK